MVIQASTIGYMPRKRKPEELTAPQQSDRHKPHGNIRLPLSILRQIDVLVERNFSDRTEEVRAAVLEYLRHKGLWPPPQP